MNNGGVQMVASGGIASGTAVINGGREFIDVGGVGAFSVISSAALS